MILSPTVAYTPTQMPFPGEDQPDAFDAELVADGEADEALEVEAIEVEVTAKEVALPEEGDEGAEETDVLADVAPATDAEIDVIEAQVVKRPAAREKSSRALALRDPLGAYMAEVRRHRRLEGGRHRRRG